MYTESSYIVYSYSCAVLLSAPAIGLQWVRTIQSFLLEARTPNNSLALGGWDDENDPYLTQTLDCNGVLSSALTNKENSSKGAIFGEYTVPWNVNSSVIEFWFALDVSHFSD